MKIKRQFVYRRGLPVNLESGSLPQLASALAYWHFQQAEAWSSSDHPGQTEMKSLLS